MAVEIVAIGEILIDFIPLEPGSYTQVPAFQKCFGGAPFNFAVAAARLGAKAGAITAVGDDPFGDFLVETLRTNKIDTSQVRTKRARTTLAFVVSDTSGERSFFFYREPWTRTADTLLSPDDVDPQYLRGVKILHCSGVALSHSPEREAVFKAIQGIGAAGGMVSYDPNVRLDLWRSVDDLRAVNDQAMKQADVVLLARDEAELLFGETEPERLVREVRRRYNPRYLALKLGEQGSYVQDDAGRAVTKPAFKVDVLDTTGAGDGWAAAFEFGLIQGWSLEDSVTVANAVGALVVTKRGAITAMPTRVELEAFLQQREIALPELRV